MFEAEFDGGEQAPGEFLHDGGDFFGAGCEEFLHGGEFVGGGEAGEGAEVEFFGEGFGVGEFGAALDEVAGTGGEPAAEEGGVVEEKGLVSGRVEDVLRLAGGVAEQGDELADVAFELVEHELLDVLRAGEEAGGIVLLASVGGVFCRTRLRRRLVAAR